MRFYRHIYPALFTCQPQTLKSKTKLWKSNPTVCFMQFMSNHNLEVNGGILSAVIWSLVKEIILWKNLCRSNFEIRFFETKQLDLDKSYLMFTLCIILRTQCCSNIGLRVVGGFHKTLERQKTVPPKTHPFSGVRRWKSDQLECWNQKEGPYLSIAQRRGQAGKFIHVLAQFGVSWVLLLALAIDI
jgi:hypothetical protein